MPSVMFRTPKGEVVAIEAVDTGLSDGEGNQLYKLAVEATLSTGPITIGAVNVQDASSLDNAKVNTVTAITEGDKALAVQAPVLGETTDAADDTGGQTTLNAKMRGLVQLIAAGLPTALGQALMAASSPVVIASDQTSVPTNLFNGANEAAIDTAAAILEGNANKLAVHDPTLGTSTGAAVITDANGTVQQYLRGLVKLFITRLPASLGQKAMSASLPVVLANDQSALPVDIQLSNGPSADAFGRLRVSNPETLFDAQLTYSLATLLMEQITSGTGATIAHDTTNRAALMTFASTPTGGKAYMQSYEYMHYVPGKSMLAFLTFVFGTGVADVLRFAGLSDGVNGIEFQQDGTTLQFKLLSDTGSGDVTVTQDNWNLDTLNGNGPSGLTLDITKTQILVIDLQALYAGRVRIGFDIGGVVYYAHQFLHANLITTPYIQTANLPVRCGMTCTGTVSATMRYICSSVQSEGGAVEVPGFSFTAEGLVTAASGVRTHILSVRPKTTFNTFTNRIKMQLSAVDLLVTGNNPVLWELCIGQALTAPSYADVNTSYSGMQAVVAATLSGSPAAVIASGYCGGSNTLKGSVVRDLLSRYPITLDQAGAVRDLGTWALLVTGIGGTSACRASLSWKEIR